MDKGGGGERRMYGENLFRFVETRLSDSMLIVLSLSSVLDAIKKIPRIGEPNSVVPKLVPLSLDLELADRFIRCFSMPFRKVELDSSFQRRRKPLMFDPSMRK